MNGTMITVPAENITMVSAKFVVEGPCQDCLPRARVSAGLAVGTVSVNSNPARFTEPVFLKNSADVATIVVPQFAISMTVLGDGSTTPIEATVVGLGGLRTRFDALMPLGNNRFLVENALPLPNGSDVVEIRAPNATGPVNAQVVFGLSL
jgi:hypothetical protein